eukprot:gb/GECG01010070.1/.p1 GENE.gb/GECG01010070.1/~~gb/GECG01010070.1/.p1  ORF type:complete len:1280 (+),score=177.81 gb/GECG01010070.1/:1-3840(+)
MTANLKVAEATQRFREGKPDSSQLRDAADDIFQIWYEEAKNYAQGPREDSDKHKIIEETVEALKAFLGAYGQILTLRADGWIEEICMQHAGNMFKVFATKPKFTELVEKGAASGNPFWEIIKQEGVPRLERIVVASGGLSWERRKKILDTLQNLFALARKLFADRSTEETTVSKFPFPVDIPKLCSIVAESDDAGILQDASLGVLGAIAGENGRGYAPMVAFHLLKIAKDSKTMTAAWNMGGLVSDHCIQLAMGRISNTRHVSYESLNELYEALKNPHSARSYTEQTFGCATKQSTSAPQRGFINEVIVSLYDALADARSEERERDDANPKLYSLADSDCAFPAMLTLLAATDVVSPVLGGIIAGLRTDGVSTVLSPEELLRLDDEEHQWERSDSWLDLYSTLLQSRCSNRFLLRLALCHPTIRTINILISLSEHFDEKTWLDVLFPFVSFSLAHMSNAVSGTQWDQDVVKLLREGIRVFYLAGDVRIDPQVRDEFGYTLFRAVLLAITAGYSEQERFAEYGARILRWHAFEHYKMSNKGDIGSIKPWLKLALSDEICQGSHRNERAIMELLMVALGIDSSAWGVEEAMDQLPKEVSESILRCLAQTHTYASYQFWKELSLNHSNFIHQYPHLGVGEFIRTTERRVNAELQRFLGGAAPHVSEAFDQEDNRRITIGELESLLLLFNELSAAVLPTTAALAFDTMLKMLILLAELSGKKLTEVLKGSGVSHDVNSVHGICSDESMAAIVEKIPSVSEVPDPLVKEALKISGPLTRAALATLAPGHFLVDVSPFVRRSALLALVNCSSASGNNDGTWRLLPPGAEFVSNMKPEEAGGLFDPFTVARLMQSVESDSDSADSFLLGCDMISGNLAVSRDSKRVYIPPAEQRVHELSLFSDAALALSSVAVATANSPALTSDSVMGGSQYVVAVLVGCISRLIKGALLSRESNPDSEPSKIFTTALGQIASSCPFSVLATFVTSTYGVKKLNEIGKLSPEWLGLVNAMERNGVIKRTMFGTKTKKSKEEDEFTSIMPGGGASAFNDQMLIEVYGDSNSLLRDMNTARNNGQLFSALSYASSLKKVDPKAFASNSCETIVEKELLPKIAQEYFDDPISTFQSSSSDLATAQRQYQLSAQMAQDLTVLLGHEYIERTLHLSTRLENLQVTIVSSLLNAGRSSDARTFLRENGIRNPRVSSVIDSSNMGQQIRPTVTNAYTPVTYGYDEESAKRPQGNGKTEAMYPSTEQVSAATAPPPDDEVPRPTAPPLEDQTQVWKEVSRLNLH